MGKKRIDYDMLRAGRGLVRGLDTAFDEACEAHDVPIEAIRRLVTPGASRTWEAIARRILADWQAEQSHGGTLPRNHYRLHLRYTPMPSLAVLKQELGENNVSDIYDGRAWETHSSCVGMDRTPGERTFFLHDVGRDWEREEQIAWGLAQRTAAALNGYRPATHDEEYEFQKAHPELLDYVALGSSTLRDGLRCVAVVWSGGGQRILVSSWFGGWFLARHRVLFVSK